MRSPWADGYGLVGRPRLGRSPDVLRAALGAQNFAVQIFEQAMPSGIVGLPAGVKKEGMDRADSAFNAKYAGTRRVIFMDAASTYTPLNITLESTANLESRKYSAEEVARIFSVPAIMCGINDHSTMTNSETSGRFFATHCLAPWVRKIELALAHALFGPGSPYTVELDMTALQRGSDTERWACWQIALANGVLSAQDVRHAEGWSGEPPAACPAMPL